METYMENTNEAKRNSWFNADMLLSEIAEIHAVNVAKYGFDAEYPFSGDHLYSL